MALTFSPVTALNELIRLDKKTAVVLVAGLAVFAAVSIASTYSAVRDLSTLGLMAAYIIGFGFILMVLANVIHHPVLSLVLGWFFTILIIATITVFFVSAVFRQQGIINPTYCLVKPWEHCSDRETEVLRRNPSAIEPVQVQPAEVRAATRQAPGVTPSEHRVYVQFAGLVARENVVSLNQALRSAGWRVEDLRGERTSAAQGVNEVRYGQAEDEQAARALAEAVSAAGLGSRPLDVKLAPRIGDGPLEVWISK